MGIYPVCPDLEPNIFLSTPPPLSVNKCIVSNRCDGSAFRRVSQSERVIVHIRGLPR